MGVAEALLVMEPALGDLAGLSGAGTGNRGSRSYEAIDGRMRIEHSNPYLAGKN